MFPGDRPRSGLGLLALRPLALGLLALGLGGLTGSGLGPVWVPGPASGPAAARPAAGLIERETLPPGVKVEPFAGPLSGPVALAFTPEGQLLVTEKAGSLRLVEADGSLLPEPILRLPTDARAERGLLGVAVDPDFVRSRQVYLYHSLDSPAVNRIVRFRLVGGRAEDVQAAYTVAPSAAIHNGGNLHFGPDGMLYLGVGEGGEPARAPDPGDRRGKILRLDARVLPLRPAADNPFTGLPGHDAAVWALGLRNPFDFSFDPQSRALLATENGPDCHDELNRIRPARDYGWRPGYDCRRPEGPAGSEAPIWTWPQPIGVTAALVYSGAVLPGWEGDLLICGWNRGTLYRAELSRDRQRIDTMREVVGVRCNLDLALGPDGALYYIEGGGYAPGSVKRIVPDPDATPGPRPTLEPWPRVYLPRAGKAG